MAIKPSSYNEGITWETEKLWSFDCWCYLPSLSQQRCNNMQHFTIYSLYQIVSIVDFVIAVDLCAFFLYDEPFWKNKNIFVFLICTVCWSDTKEISPTTCSAGPHYANIILDIFWYLRYILYTYPSGDGCFAIFSCMVVILTDFLLFIWYYWGSLGYKVYVFWDTRYMYSL